MQRTTVGLAAGLALLASVALAPGEARALTVEDLIGTWHVLAHYKDSGTDHPERERWVDRVWKFEWEGDKLKWTDYPIVVFEDETGRFERLGTNRQSRILHYWEPSPVQLADIGDGLEVNKRGAKSKTLKPVDGDDWSSAGRARPQSMTFISYVETWSIRGLPDAPVFERADSLSSGMTETLEGVTRYSTEAVDAGGQLLTGRYERDGTQEGTFQMRRSGDADWVRGSGKTQGERLMEAWFGSLGGALGGEEMADAEARRAIEAGEVDDEMRAEIRAQIRASLAEGMREAGGDPRTDRAALDSLTRQVERLMIDEKKSSDEIAEMLRNGQIRP